jgi:hypothetical protein
MRLIGCNDDYAEGALKLNGSNPMVAANWIELTGPLFGGTATNGNYATATYNPFRSPNVSTPGLSMAAIRLRISRPAQPGAVDDMDRLR